MKTIEVYDDDYDNLLERAKRENKSIPEIEHEMVLMTDSISIEKRHNAELAKQKDYYLAQSEHRQKYFTEQLNRQQDEISCKYKQKTKNSLSKQRGIMLGKKEEKLFPLCAENPHDIDDLIAVFNTYDYEILRGRREGNINSIIKIETKTGDGCERKLVGSEGQLRNLICSINDPRIIHQHWAKRDEGDIWHLVEY